MPNKKQKFGTPFVMKGSPHKLGTIEDTSAFRAKKKFAVEQTRTSGDAAIVGAASELGSSYVPASQDYTIKTGHITKDKKDGKKKNGKKTTKPKTDKEIKLEETSKLGDFGTGATYWQSGGGFGEKLFIDPAHETPKPKKKIRVEGQPYTGKEVRKKTKGVNWSEYLKTGKLYE